MSFIFDGNSLPVPSVTQLNVLTGWLSLLYSYVVLRRCYLWLYSKIA